MKEYTGSVGKITLPKHNNTIEVLHTHDCEIHLSTADLCSLYRRYMRGDISNISEFKYISVSPDYIVVLQINNEQQVRNLIIFLLGLILIITSIRMNCLIIINNYIFRVYRMERIEAWKITLKTS